MRGCDVYYDCRMDKCTSCSFYITGRYPIGISSTSTRAPTMCKLHFVGKLIRDCQMSTIVDVSLFAGVWLLLFLERFRNNRAPTSRAIADATINQVHVNLLCLLV